VGVKVRDPNPRILGEGRGQDLSGEKTRFPGDTLSVNHPPGPPTEEEVHTPTMGGVGQDKEVGGKILIGTIKIFKGREET
jgi:hypothetical protein